MLDIFILPTYVIIYRNVACNFSPVEYISNAIPNYTLHILHISVLFSELGATTNLFGTSCTVNHSVPFR